MVIGRDLKAGARSVDRRGRGVPESRRYNRQLIGEAVACWTQRGHHEGRGKPSLFIMTRFTGGPADGKTLLLKRAPLYLRVVMDVRTREIDALDQLDDTAGSDETISVYRCHGEPIQAHINFGRKGGGWYEGGDYRIVDPQPGDAEVRENAAWRAWAVDRAAHTE